MWSETGRLRVERREAADRRASPPPERKPAPPTWRLPREERETCPALLRFSSGVRGGSEARGERHAAMERGGIEQPPARAPQVRSAALSGFSQGAAELEGRWLLLRTGLSSGFVRLAAALAFVISEFLFNSMKKN